MAGMFRALCLPVASLCVLGIALAACGEKPAPTPTSAAPTRLRIAVVPKGTTHEYWKSVHAGALSAGKELGVDVTFQGPEREDDREQQVALVQNLTGARQSAIVLAPLDNAALVGPVRGATAAGIPVVIIDSGLDGVVGTDFVSYVATDNTNGGAMGAAQLAKVMSGQGRVLLLRYLEGSLSTTQREQGFIDSITSNPGIELVDPRRYAGATRATAQEAAENLLAANPDIQGVFCPNEPSTFGMLLALKSRGMLGKVKFVGFDASDAAIAALRAGEMDGIVVQNPVRMGYLGVRTAVQAARGQRVDQRIDTGVTLITRENIDTPESQALLKPDLSALGGSK